MHGGCMMGGHSQSFWGLGMAQGNFETCITNFCCFLCIKVLKQWLDYRPMSWQNKPFQWNELLPDEGYHYMSVLGERENLTLLMRILLKNIHPGGFAWLWNRGYIYVIHCSSDMWLIRSRSSESLPKANLRTTLTNFRTRYMHINENEDLPKYYWC